MSDALLKIIAELRTEIDTLKARCSRQGGRIDRLENDLARFNRDNEYMHRRDNDTADKNFTWIRNHLQGLLMEICHIRDNNNERNDYEREIARVIGAADYHAPERLKPVAKIDG